MNDVLEKIEKLIVDGNNEVVSRLEKKLEEAREELRQGLGGKIDNVETSLRQEIRTEVGKVDQKLDLYYKMLDYDVKQVDKKVDGLKDRLENHLYPAHS